MSLGHLRFPESCWGHFVFLYIFGLSILFSVNKVSSAPQSTEVGELEEVEKSLTPPPLLKTVSDSAILNEGT